VTHVQFFILISVLLAGGGVDIVDAKVYMIMVKLLLIIVHSQYVHASGKQVVCYIN